MKGLNCIAWILVVIGAINWGLIGVFDYNVVNVIFASVPVVSKIIYILVGLSGLYLIFRCKSCCK